MPSPAFSIWPVLSSSSLTFLCDMHSGLPSFGIFQSVAHTGPGFVGPVLTTLHSPFSAQSPKLVCGLLVGVGVEFPPQRPPTEAKAQILQGVGVGALSFSPGEGGGQEKGALGRC